MMRERSQPELVVLVSGDSLFYLQGIGYQKHCNEFTVTRCRTVYDTSSEERCWTVYKKQCEMVRLRLERSTLNTYTFYLPKGF